MDLENTEKIPSLPVGVDEVQVIWQHDSSAGTSHLRLQQHHLSVLGVFQLLLNNIGSRVDEFFACAEARYALYLDLLNDQGDIDTDFHPPWYQCLVRKGQKRPYF